MFGRPASEAVRELLVRRGHRVRRLVVSHRRARLRGRRPERPADRGRPRHLAAPRSRGAGSPACPADDDGFIPVDAHGRVPHLAGVYAAGDGTSFPIKQGGLATQQADAVAEAIAAEAGADVEPEPFRPVLRGLLLTGGDAPLLPRTPSRAATARARSRATRSGGRRPRSPAATSRATCSSATKTRPSRRSAPGTSRSTSRSMRMRPPGTPSSRVRAPRPGGLRAARRRRRHRPGRGRGRARLGLERPQPAAQRAGAVAARARRPPVRELDGAAARRAAALISVAIGELLDAGVILAIVVANAVFGAVQEGRADKAAAAVRALLAPTFGVLVLRQFAIRAALERAPEIRLPRGTWRGQKCLTPRRS